MKLRHILAIQQSNPAAKMGWTVFPRSPVNGERVAWAGVYWWLTGTDKRRFEKLAEDRGCKTYARRLNYVGADGPHWELTFYQPLP